MNEEFHRRMITANLSTLRQNLTRQRPANPLLPPPTLQELRDAQLVEWAPFLHVRGREQQLQRRLGLHPDGVVQLPPGRLRLR